MHEAHGSNTLHQTTSQRTTFRSLKTNPSQKPVTLVIWPKLLMHHRTRRTPDKAAMQLMSTLTK